MESCSVETCADERHSELYCEAHYRRLIRTGDLRADKPIDKRNVKQRICSLDYCGDKHYAKGFCLFHYDRQRAGRSLDAPKQKQNPRGAGRSICTVKTCDRIVSSGGLCFAHHQRRLRGVPIDDRPLEPRFKSDDERFVAYTEREPVKGCLLWTGAKINGYGSITSGYQNSGGTPAHRVAYERATGEKLKPYEAVHHICAVRNCVEPTHLQKVSTVENGVEMLERNWYLKRIADLEAALTELSPSHPLISAEAVS